MRGRSIFLNGIIVAIAGFVCVLFYNRLHPNKQSALAELTLDSVGLTIILFGQYIRISARGYKSESRSEDNGLITKGPYAIVRHPMYLASFLIGLGIVVILLNWWMLPVYLGFFALWYWPQVRNEEQRLVKKFGQQFLDYRSTTPTFFPRLRDILSLNSAKYLPIKLAWLKLEYNTILALSVVVVLAESYEDITSYGLSDFLIELLFLLLIVFYFTAFALLFRER